MPSEMVLPVKILIFSEMPDDIKRELKDDRQQWVNHTGVALTARAVALFLTERTVEERRKVFFQ